MIKTFEKHKVIAIVGLEKNTGKTETFNFLLKNLNKRYTLGITSIGIDGEEKDQVTFTKKPNIFVEKNIIFATTEKYFKMKNFSAEILYVSDRRTSTGRIIIARARERGKIILAGPTTIDWLNEINNKLFNFGAKKILIDGALSRISSSSISDAVVLATGAAVSLDVEKIASKTIDLIYKINLPKYKLYNLNNINLEKGIYLKDLKLLGESTLNFEDFDKLKEVKEIIIIGALTDSFVKKLIDKNIILDIIVKDFSKIFAKSSTLKLFKKLGGNIFVLNKPNLCLITINPTSPYGYQINEEVLIEKISKEIDIPVVNIRKVDSIWIQVLNT